LLTTLLTGLVLPALLLTTLAGFLPALLTTLIMLAALVLLTVSVWIVHGLFFLVDFNTELTSAKRLRSCVSFDTAIVGRQWAAI
jgi:hypothetical protein